MGYVDAKIYAQLFTCLKSIQIIMFEHQICNAAMKL